MSRMTQALAVLLVLALAASAGLLSRNKALARNLAAEQARATTLATTLTATHNSLTVYMARAKASAARADQTQKELTHALQTHQDWREGAVPDAVFDSLYHPRARTPAAPAPAAGALP